MPLPPIIGINNPYHQSALRQVLMRDSFPRVTLALIYKDANQVVIFRLGFSGRPFPQRVSNRDPLS